MTEKMARTSRASAGASADDVEEAEEVGGEALRRHRRRRRRRRRRLEEMPTSTSPLSLSRLRCSPSLLAPTQRCRVQDVDKDLLARSLCKEPSRCGGTHGALALPPEFGEWLLCSRKKIKECERKLFARQPKSEGTFFSSFRSSLGSSRR